MYLLKIRLSPVRLTTCAFFVFLAISEKIWRMNSTVFPAISQKLKLDLPHIYPGTKASQKLAKNPIDATVLATFSIDSALSWL